MTESDVLSQLQRHRSGKPVVQVQSEPERIRVAVYARISDAWEQGQITTEGVERQQEACSHIVQARGWETLETYIDNNVSAFKIDVRRPEFERLLEDLQSGVVAGLVAYNLDRIARQVSDLERLIAVYDSARKAGRPLTFATAQGDLDLSSDDGLTMARVMVAFANKASRDAARRISAKNQSRRDSGRAVGGARPFGWDRTDDGKRQINDKESAAIKWACTALTTGASWRDVAAHWNAEGVLSPNGKPWSHTTAKNTMRSPRLAGWLVHKDAIAVHSQTGELIRADVEPILTDDEFEAMLQAVAGRAGSDYGTASNRKRYLLSGIARCASCGGRLSGNAFCRGSSDWSFYRCDDQECRAKVSCSIKSLDAYVLEQVGPRIVKESQRLRIIDLPPHGEEKHDLETEREDLIARYDAKEVPSDVVFPRVAKIDARLEEVRTAQRLHRMAQAQLHGEKLTMTKLLAMPVDEQRQHLERHVESVRILPRLKNTGRRFDTDRVQAITYRERIK